MDKQLSTPSPPSDLTGFKNLSGLQPPAHVAALLQQNGLAYDPATFAGMSLEQHTDEGFKGLRVSVLAAVYSGMHFSQVIEKFKQMKLDVNSSKRLDDFKSAKQFITSQAEQRNVSIHTIYNMIGTYELFERSPEPVLQVFTKLDYSKLLEFKRFEQTDLEELANGNEVYGITLETAQTCSVRELKNAFKEYALNNQPYRRLEKKLDEARKVILDKDAKLEMANKLTLHNGQPAIINDMRTLSTTITGEILRLLDALEDLEVTLAKGVESGLSLESEKRTQQLRAGLIPWSINLNVIMARAQQINTAARSHFAAELFPRSAEDMVQLDEMECISARSHYAFMTDLMSKVQLKQQLPREKPKKKGAKK